MNYIEITTALDGKKYKESGSMSEDFFKSRHKNNCLKIVNGEYTMYSRDIKRDGKFFSVCVGCGHECINNAMWHEEEDLIKK